MEHQFLNDVIENILHKLAAVAPTKEAIKPLKDYKINNRGDDQYTALTKTVHKMSPAQRNARFHDALNDDSVPGPKETKRKGFMDEIMSLF